MNILFLVVCGMSLVFFGIFFLACHSGCLPKEASQVVSRQDIA